MKNEFLSSYPELKKEELQQLCIIVDETLASDIVIPQAKEKRSSFRLADFWNLQRNMVTTGRRWNGIFRIYYVRG